jgi:hypothetical protein
MTKRQCASGTACAAYAKLGGPAKLSRYNPETVCSECLLARRAARSAAEAEVEGTIHERKDGRWEARYYDAAGIRQSIYGGSQATVHVKLVAALDHVRENQSTRD